MQLALEADDRTGLERLCNYISGPPIAMDRLELTADGSVHFPARQLSKRTW